MWNFVRDGSFFMSYANDACSNRFSQEQTDAMRANLTGPRASFLYNQNPPILIAPATPTLTSPINDEMVENTNTLVLSWEAVPNATGYVIDLDLIASNGSIFNFDYLETTETSIDVTDLVSDKNWRWRVRAYSLNDGCTTYSDFATFTTGAFISNTKEIPGLSQMELLPIPQASGQDLLLNWTAEQSMPITMKVVNHTGQLIKTHTWESLAGYNQRQINTDGMAAGMYILLLENSLGINYKRFVLK